MAYNYPFKPWFSLTTSPKCLFWPLLIGSFVFWVIMSLVRSVFQTLLDILNALEEERHDSCCTLNFLLKAPLLLVSLAIACPIGIHHHLSRDVKNLWQDTKYTVQWHKQKRA